MYRCSKGPEGLRNGLIGAPTAPDWLSGDRHIDGDHIDGLATS